MAHIDLSVVGELSVVLERAGIHVAHLEEELIAREGQDFQTLVLIPGVQVIEALVAHCSGENRKKI